jgi:uncharacterized Zn finger protein (UPF0148 family)
MPVIKTRCPECDVALRLTIDGIESQEVECPKCGHEFLAELEEKRASKPAKTVKAAKRKPEPEDDDTPRADFNRDGVVYLNELVYYASARVQELSRGQQHPTIGRPPAIRPFPIAKP